MSAECEECGRDLDYDLTCAACVAQAALRREKAVSKVMEDALTAVSTDGNLGQDAFELNESKKEITIKALAAVKELRSGK
jgi:hypothetical protein